MSRPVPEKYQFSLTELPVNMGWIRSLLGYPEGDLPEPLPAVIDSILKEAPDHTNIQGGYLIKDNVEIGTEPVIRVDGLEFHPTKAIARQVRAAEQMAFFMITAGEGITEWSQKELTQGDPMAGYIIDLIGSEIVVAALEKMQDELAAKMTQEGLRITNRYSPGDCGWPVTDQQKLFMLFPENFCGISLSESSLMHPIKSVSGIIGIGKHVRKTAYACDFCEMDSCVYRYRKEARSVP
jgi:hypothetical protein